VTEKDNKRIFQSGKDVLNYYIPNYSEPYEIEASPLTSWVESKEKARSVAQGIVHKNVQKIKKEIEKS
jgi:hypothetical protein